MESIGGETVQRSVVQHDHRVCVLDQAARCWDRVVRLHHDVGAAVLREKKEKKKGYEVGEHGIGLDDLFRKCIVEVLEEEGTHAGTRSAGDAVH